MVQIIIETLDFAPNIVQVMVGAILWFALNPDRPWLP